MRKFFLIIIPPILFVLIMMRCQTKNYKEMLESLYNHTVPVISSAELNKKITTKTPIVILDIRSKEEYLVSHLEDAIFIDYDQFQESDVRNIPKDAQIIVYCSVGYRSEKVGEVLQEKGYANVKNLYGGIFQWKNDGFSVVNDHSIETDSVHTYNRSWSKWLVKGVKVY